MIKVFRKLLCGSSMFCVTFFMSAILSAAELTIRSSPTSTTLLELYTSQGCSSCPPAEKWLSNFTDNKKLWRELIPINFHVDYWDDLGWEDPFATAEFSRRQRRYAEQGYSRNVGTPGFIVDGRGWTGWFQRLWSKRKSLPLPAILPTHNLQAIISEEKIELSYDDNTGDDLVAHIAILGFGIETDVRTGENGGRKLRHDFVVIGYRTNRLSGKGRAEIFDLPKTLSVNSSRRGIVVWVAKTNDPTPLQVAGNWFKQ